MKPINMVLAFTLLSVACSSPQWVKPGSTPDDLEADTVACNNEILTSSIGARAIAGMGAPTPRGRSAMLGGARVDAERALEQCLEEKGWTKK